MSSSWMSRKYFLILRLEAFLFSCSFCSSVGCLVIVLYKLALVKKRGKFSISQVGGPGLLIWTLLLWYLIIHLFLFPVTNVNIFEIPLSLIGTILSICKEPGFLCIFKCCSWNSWVINILENLTLFGDCIVKHGWEVKWYFQNDRPFADKDSFKQCYTCINKQNHLLLCNSTNTSWS